MSTDAAARTVLSYLAETDPAPTSAADAVIGFGVFDLTLPRFCTRLYREGLARRIVFTGGLGAGTGDLGGPEADVWRDEARRFDPALPADAIVTENRSTNTAENIEYTAAVLRRLGPDYAFGEGIRTAIVVASPSRLRRVRLTLRKLVPELHVIRMLPAVDFEAEEALYRRQGVDYLAHLVGELDRLAAYPARGWIAPEPLPAEIVAAGARLRSVASR
jgi:uncharacterized SAM-binding protein YcdF (DUF218 family)